MKTAMRVAAGLILLLSSFAFGQRWDSNLWTTIGAGPAYLITVPNASVSFCEYPAVTNTAGVCTNSAVSYTTASLGTPCPSNTPVVWQSSNTCQATTDVQGNFGFYAAGGLYTYTVTSNSRVYGPYVISISSGNSFVQQQADWNQSDSQAVDYIKNKPSSGTTSPLTTKGDLWGFGTGDARVPVGSDDNCFLADSTQALGVKWAACPASTPVAGMTPDIIPPGSGSYAILYPTTVAQYNNGAGTSYGQTNCNTSGGFINRIHSAPLGDWDVWCQWGGYSLPGYISQANVTGIYGVVISNSNHILGYELIECGLGSVSYAADINFSGASAGATLNSNGQFNLTLATGAPATSYNIPGVTCAADNASSLSLTNNDLWYLNTVALVVTYTGTQGALPSGVHITPPLFYSPTLNTLSIPKASIYSDGYLSFGDYAAFTDKQAKITANNIVYCDNVGNCVAGTAAQVVALIGSTAVQNATAAATATALAANGGNCSGANEAAKGTDASGVAEDCFNPVAYIPGYTVASLPGSPFIGQTVQVSDSSSSSSCATGGGSNKVLCRWNGSSWDAVGGGGVTAFSGDGGLLNNSNSTGAVTATLANAAAHKFWGNNTGSTASPGYESITLADLPSASRTKCDAQDLGAVDDGTTDNRTILNNALSTCTGGIIFTQNTGSDYFIGSNLTFTVPVAMHGGRLKSTGAVLAFNAGFKAPTSKVFTLSGGGVVNFGAGQEEVFAEWWDAKGDYVWNTGGTNDYTALNAALNSISVSGGHLTLLNKYYSIGTNTLSIPNHRVSIHGTGRYWGKSVIVSTSTTATIVSAQGGGVGSEFYGIELRGFQIIRNAVPTNAAINLNLKYLTDTDIRDMNIIDFGKGIYVYDAPNTHYTNILMQQANYTPSSTPTCGVCVDTSSGVPSDAGIYDNVTANDLIGNGQLKGFYLYGTAINDHWLRGFASNGTYGIYIDPTNCTASSFACDDIRATEFILDGCGVECIHVNNVSSTTTAHNVQFSNGWASAATGSTHNVNITNSSAILVSDILFNNGPDFVYISGGSGNSVTNIMGLVPTKGIVLNATSNNKIDSNMLKGKSGATTLIDLIGSTKNTVEGNKLYGTATTGIAADSTSNNNTVIGNDVDTANITTDYSFNSSATGNTIFTPNRLHFGTKCTSSASPAVCGSAPAGLFNVPAGSTSVTVNTTAVTANSVIQLVNDSTLGTALSVTCNTALLTDPPQVTARTAGTSFTVTLSAAPATNPQCFAFQVTN
jgi:parallel beta-helix repeat protein